MNDYEKAKIELEEQQIAEENDLYENPKAKSCGDNPVKYATISGDHPPVENLKSGYGVGKTKDHSYMDKQVMKNTKCSMGVKKATKK